MSNDKNTFGSYKFDDWVPEHNRELITSFWGIFGRTYKDWFGGMTSNENHKFNGANGYDNPNYGDHCVYFLMDRKASIDAGVELFKKVEGRYIHHWSNIGSVVDKYGDSHSVSSCYQWFLIGDKNG